jgi:hypothetical protein
MMPDDVSRGAPLPNIPSPDPSALTTQTLHEGLLNLRQLLETRLNAMDKASEVLSENVNRVPTLLDRQIAQIKELFGEKFEGVEKQFTERDVRTDQDKLAATTAVNAALQAQKEAAAAQNIANAAAINKSEAGFTKEIDGLKLLINATRDALAAQFADLTARVNRGEAMQAGSVNMRTEQRLNIGAVVGLIMGAVGVAALGFTAMAFFGQHSTTPQAIYLPAPVAPVPVSPRP